MNPTCGPLQRLANDLYCMEVDGLDFKRGRRMTIIRLPSKELVVHCGVRLDEAGMRDIDALGVVAYYIPVPNPHHDPDATWYAERYPAARFLGERDWPEALTGILHRHRVAGIRFSETVLFHAPSRTLVVVDLVFNWTAAYFVDRPLQRLFMKLNDAYDRFGMTRFARLLISERRAFRASMATILAWDFDRVVVGHGAVLERGGKQAMRRATPV